LDKGTRSALSARIKARKEERSDTNASVEAYMSKDNQGKKGGGRGRSPSSLKGKKNFTEKNFNPSRGEEERKKFLLSEGRGGEKKAGGVDINGGRALFHSLKAMWGGEKPKEQLHRERRKKGEGGGEKSLKKKLPTSAQKKKIYVHLGLGEGGGRKSRTEG